MRERERQPPQAVHPLYKLVTWADRVCTAGFGPCHVIPRVARRGFQRHLELITYCLCVHVCCAQCVLWHHLLVAATCSLLRAPRACTLSACIPSCIFTGPQNLCHTRQPPSLLLLMTIT